MLQTWLIGLTGALGVGAVLLWSWRWTQARRAATAPDLVARYRRVWAARLDEVPPSRSARCD